VTGIRQCLRVPRVLGDAFRGTGQCGFRGCRGVCEEAEVNAALDLLINNTGASPLISALIEHLQKRAATVDSSGLVTTVLAANYLQSSDSSDTPDRW
jgi:hypothetical protein